MRGLTAHFCFLPFRYFNFKPHAEAVFPILSYSSLPIPVMRQFLDIVHQTIQFPLRIHFLLSPKRKAVELLVVAQVTEYRFDGGEAPAVLNAALRAVDAPLHFVGVTFLSVGFAVEEGDLPGFGFVRGE
jgi:hypothetical protein